MTPANLTVITFHYVRPLERTRFPEIKGLHVHQFREQVDYCRKAFTMVSMDQVVAAIDGSEQLPARACLLTFDDGYIDHYTYCFPILEAARISGAFYPPSSAVIERRVLDVNKVHFLLASVADKEWLATEIDRLVDEARGRYQIPPRESLVSQYRVPNRFDTATVIYIKRLLQHALPETLRAEITSALFARFVSSDEVAFAEELYMSPDQVAVMARNGMHFGGHGRQHLWLSRLSEEGQLAEIEAATDLLERIGAPRETRSFAYPYGDYDARTTDLLSRAGYRVAFTSKVGVAGLGSEPPLELSRFDTNDAWRQAA